jgi:hypothetical protein
MGIPAEPFNCGTSYARYMSFKATVKEVSKIGERDPGTSVLKETGVLINVGKRRIK